MNVIDDTYLSLKILFDTLKNDYLDELRLNDLEVEFSNILHRLRQYKEFIVLSRVFAEGKCLKDE